MKRILCLLMLLVMILSPLCLSAQEDVYPAPLLRDGVVGDKYGCTVFREDGKIYATFSYTRNPNIYGMEVVLDYTIEEFREILEKGIGLKSFNFFELWFKEGERLLLLDIKGMQLPTAPGFVRQEKATWINCGLQFTLSSDQWTARVYVPAAGPNIVNDPDWEREHLYAGPDKGGYITELVYGSPVNSYVEEVDGREVRKFIGENYKTMLYSYQEGERTYYVRELYSRLRGELYSRCYFVVSPTEYFVVRVSPDVPEEVISSFSLEPYFPNGAYFEEASEAEDPDSEESNIFPWLWVGIGGGAAVAIGGAVAAALIVRKKRRRA